ncbi:MAG: hypothetical protein J4452_04440 [Candidatus Aenigmarchaeota archaeon]|nr:hypothetical protein [Candidatus Aenigmarchaeota archaeon]
MPSTQKPVFIFRLKEPVEVKSMLEYVGQQGVDVKYSPRSDMPDTEAAWILDHGSSYFEAGAAVEKSGFRLEITYKGHGIKLGKK